MHLLSLAGATVLWSTSFPVIRWALYGAEPGPLLAVRFATAAVGSLLAFPLMGKSVPWRVFKNPWVWLLGASTALGFSLQFFGQKLTSASMAALFVNLYVILVALASPLVGERPGPRLWTGVILGFVGAVIASTGLELDFLGKASFLGNALCAGAAAAFALYVLVSKKNISQGLGAMELTFGVNLIAGALLLPLLPTGEISSIVIGVGAYLGIFCTLLPFFLYLWSLKGLSAVASSVMLLGEVVLAMVWSFLFLGERLSPAEAAGAALVLAAIALAGKG